MSTRVLVTGGAGFIGSSLVIALLQRNFEVVVLDNLEPRVHGQRGPIGVPQGAEFIRGDVRDKSAWQRALQGVEVVFHEAAYQDYMPDYSKFFSTNVVGTALLYEVIREQGLDIRRVVVASSQAVYGEGQYECAEHGLVLPPARAATDLEKGDWEVKCPRCGRETWWRLLQEEHPNPQNQYAVSKYAQELAALRLGKILGVPTVALRYSITQGPRQSPFNSYSGVCRIFTLRLLHGFSPLIYEDGLQLRDYVHIDDVVDANLCVLHDARADYRCFNVGSGIATSVLEYARVLGETLGSRVPPCIPGKFRVGDNRNSTSCIAQLRRLGWSPRRGLRDILSDYVAWLRDSGLQGQYFLAADADMEQHGVVRNARMPLTAFN